MKDAITRDPAQLRGALRAIARKSLGVIDFPGRAQSNDYGDFLVRVPTKIWPNLDLDSQNLLNYAFK